MDKDDMILISVDDHIIEPPDMFAHHLPGKYVDEAPRLVHNPNGSDTWQFRDTVIPNVALNAVAGRPKEEYGLEPQGLDEIRKGCYDAAERVKDMNAGGVLATMNPVRYRLRGHLGYRRRDPRAVAGGLLRRTYPARRCRSGLADRAGGSLRPRADRHGRRH